MQDTPKPSSASSTVGGNAGGPIRAAVAVILLPFFIRFVGPALFTGFAVDDPMNIYYYWHAGPAQLLRNLVLFATDFERPMGGVFYLLLYGAFGLNPLPYHAVAASLLLVNCLLAFRFARLLGGSFLTAALTAMPLAFHPRMAQLAYLPSYIFDVLCFRYSPRSAPSSPPFHVAAASTSSTTPSSSGTPSSSSNSSTGILPSASPSAA